MQFIANRTGNNKIITLEQAKNQLNIVDFNDDDDHIESLIDTATDMIESYKKHYYIQTEVKVRLSEGDFCVYLERGPVDSIISVVNDQNNIDYKYNEFNGLIRLEKAQMNLAEQTIITYQAGYADSQQIPDIVKHACKIIVADLYEHRESVIDTGMTDNMFGALRLLN